MCPMHSPLSDSQHSTSSRVKCLHTVHTSMWPHTAEHAQKCPPVGVMHKSAHEHLPQLTHQTHTNTHTLSLSLTHTHTHTHTRTPPLHCSTDLSYFLHLSASYRGHSLGGHEVTSSTTSSNTDLHHCLIDCPLQQTHFHLHAWVG